MFPSKGVLCVFFFSVSFRFSACFLAPTFHKPLLLGFSVTHHRPPFRPLGTAAAGQLCEASGGGGAMGPKGSEKEIPQVWISREIAEIWKGHLSEVVEQSRPEQV